MTDMEKVKKGLYQHCEGSMFDRCGECPYYEVADEPFQCRDAILMDVLALLKEQEPKPVKITKNSYNYEFYYCPNCGRNFDTTYYKRPSFCDKCGQAVKWND